MQKECENLKAFVEDSQERIKDLEALILDKDHKIDEYCLYAESNK